MLISIDFAILIQNGSTMSVNTQRIANKFAIQNGSPKYQDTKRAMMPMKTCKNEKMYMQNVHYEVLYISLHGFINYAEQ